MSRKNHWQAIYQDKSPKEVSWYQARPTISLSLIHSVCLQKDENIIDVGGGASTLVDCLLDDGYKHITVVDISSNALELAKRRLGDKAGMIDWQEADITQFVPSRLYSVWHDRAVFHFLTEPEDRAQYIDVLKTAVRKDGYVVIAAFAPGGPTKCSGLDIVQYDADKLAKELGTDFRLLEEMSESHLTPAGREQLFGYYVFLKHTG